MEWGDQTRVVRSLRSAGGRWREVRDAFRDHAGKCEKRRDVNSPLDTPPEVGHRRRGICRGEGRRDYLSYSFFISDLPLLSFQRRQARTPTLALNDRSIGILSSGGPRSFRRRRKSCDDRSRSRRSRVDVWFCRGGRRGSSI